MSLPDLISVIVATHNRAPLLRKTLTALLAQDHTELEVIVVDDGSKDNTHEVIDQARASDSRIEKLRLEMSGGPGRARNLGVAAARGAWIAICDDDDIPRPHRLSVQLAAAKAAEADLCFSAVRWVDGHGRELCLFPGIVARNEFPAESAPAFELLYLESNKIPNTTCLFRTSVFRDLGGYPEDLLVGEDWLLCLNLLRRNSLAIAIAEPLMDVLRADELPRLTARHRLSFSCQREVLRRIRAELALAGDHRFDHLHRRAWAAQLSREAAYWSGLRGLALVVGALLSCPTSPHAQAMLRRLGTRAMHKTARAVGGS